jgi:hypothetical protein
MMSERDMNRIAGIGWQTIYRCTQATSPVRSRRAPLTAPRRTERRGIPAWSPRSIAERRPLRRIHCHRRLW